MGFLGFNPEIKKFGDNKSMARVSLATNESYKNKDGDWVTETHWHNLIMWGSQAAYAERNLTKGSEVAIEGRLINHTYEDKEGIKRYVSEIVVNHVMALSKKEKPEPILD